MTQLSILNSVDHDTAHYCVTAKSTFLKTSISLATNVFVSGDELFEKSR